jgi:hypothetical protein
MIIMEPLKIALELWGFTLELEVHPGVACYDVKVKTSDPRIVKAHPGVLYSCRQSYSCFFTLLRNSLLFIVTINHYVTSEHWEIATVAEPVGELLHISIVRHVALKSASFFFVAPQRKLRFSKAQLRSLRLKTFKRNFYSQLL